MPYLRSAAVVLVGFLLLAHGLAHAPGALGSLELATFEDVSHQPNVLLTSAGDVLMIALGLLWAVAGLAFVATGASVALKLSWARPAAIAALAVSLPVTVLWYQDAVAGLVINIAVLAVLIAGALRSAFSGERMTPATR